MDEAPAVFGDAIGTLLRGDTLGEDLAYTLFTSMLDGSLGDARVAALLALLATRDEDSAELAGAARAMREHVTPVEFKRPERSILIDTCGTGGAPKTFNVSTCAALVLAGVTPPASSGYERVLVAKHGNRSRTGRGSAEVLIELGVNVDADPGVQARCLETCGVCFCFAVHHHPSIKHAMPARRALGVPTIFNALGPMTNPAGADAQLIGVYKPGLLSSVSGAMTRLGETRGAVVHSDDGLDEATVTAPFTMEVLGEHGSTSERIDPRDLGFEQVQMESVRAFDVAHSAQIVRSLLGGEKNVFRPMVLVTCGAALYASGVSASIGEGVAMSEDSIGSGRAMNALEGLVRISST